MSTTKRRARQRCWKRSIEIVANADLALQASGLTPRCGHGNQFGNRLTIASDQDLLARRDAIEKLREVGLGFMNVYRIHAPRYKTD